MATKRDLLIDQGTDRILILSVFDNNTTTISDLTGFTVKFAVSENCSTLPVLLIDQTSGITINTVTGKITIPITNTLTSGLKFAGCQFSGIYQVEVTDPSGKKFRLLEGKFIVSKEIIH